MEHITTKVVYYKNRYITYRFCYMKLRNSGSSTELIPFALLLLAEISKKR